MADDFDIDWSDESWAATCAIENGDECTACEG